jgi:hypothetical protein
LLGIVSRPTKDVDILAPIIPQEIHVAARAFAAEIRATGEVLHDDWLNERIRLARWLTIYRWAGKNVWKMFSTARHCIFAALVDTIYCAPSFLLCVIAA